MNDQALKVQRAVAGAVLVLVIGVFFTAQISAFRHMKDWTMDVSPTGTDDWFGWSNAVISEVTPVAGMLSLWLAVQRGTSRLWPAALIIYGLGISTIAQTAAAGSDPGPSTLFVTLLPAVSAFILLKVGFGMLDLLGIAPAPATPAATASPVSTPAPAATPPLPPVPVTPPVAAAVPPVVEVAEDEVAEEPSATPPVEPDEVAEPEVAEPAAEVADDDTATLATVTPIHPTATPPADDPAPARTGGPRQQNARDALALVAAGMSVADACAQTGAKVRTVERWAPQYRPTNELAAAGSRK